MISKEKIIGWNFIFFVLISFYSMGAGFVESLVNYPLWHIIGPTDVWTSYHTALGPKIIPVLAIPALLLQLITNILLFFHRPVLIPRQAVWITLLLLLVASLSSALIQIPIQAELDNGYSEELVDSLIKSDLFFRVAVSVLRSTVIVYMMHCLLGGINTYNIKYRVQNKHKQKPFGRKAVVEAKLTGIQ